MEKRTQHPSSREKNPKKPPHFNLSLICIAHHTIYFYCMFYILFFAHKFLKKTHKMMLIKLDTRTQTKTINFEFIFDKKNRNKENEFEKNKKKHGKKNTKRDKHRENGIQLFKSTDFWDIIK